jgi:glycosyltransferase involved in cell wall biosynthesis
MSVSKSDLTVIALAWNEAEHLKACFDSLRPLIELTRARTLIVLDADADAQTTEVARQVAERVEMSPFVSFSAQRNRALEFASTEWVFFIDADERCTSELAQEISRALTRTDCDAFRVSRRNILFGHEVRHTGWWPDYQLRLLRRSRARYDEMRQVHEFPQVEGEICTLLEPLIHFNYGTWGQFFRKQRSYGPLEARALYDLGQRARPRSLLGQPLREFKRRFFDYKGYRDGLLGLALSIAMAVYRADISRRLLQMQREADG